MKNTYQILFGLATTPFDINFPFSLFMQSYDWLTGFINV